MANQKEVIIKLTEDQRSQIKSVTGQDLTELKVGMVDAGNPLSTNPLEDRANPFAGAVDALEDRANPFAGAVDALEDRANPFAGAVDALEDRANPLFIGEE